jgi:hypothetical protein
VHKAHKDHEEDLGRFFVFVVIFVSFAPLPSVRLSFWQTLHR